MPIYAYACGACGATHDFLQKMSEGPKRKCPSCGALRLRKQVTAAAFHLKGSGWYVTDFRDNDKKKAKEEGKAEGKTDSAGKSESTSSGDSGAKGEAGGKSGGKSSSASGSGGSGASTAAD